MVSRIRNNKFEQQVAANELKQHIAKAPGNYYLDREENLAISEIAA